MKKEHHYDITGSEVEYQEPDEEQKPNNKEYLTIVFYGLIGAGVLAIIIANICKW